TFGNIQFIDWKARHLTIVAHHGFSPEFLARFKRVTLRDTTACARAALQRRPIAIADVTSDSAFTPYLEAARSAGFHAVHSFPTILGSGAFIGVLSTHIRLRHTDERRMRMIVAGAQTAADLIVRQRAQESVPESVQ